MSADDSDFEALFDGMVGGSDSDVEFPVALEGALDACNGSSEPDGEAASVPDESDDFEAALNMALDDGVPDGDDAAAAQVAARRSIRNARRRARRAQVPRRHGPRRPRSAEHRGCNKNSNQSEDPTTRQQNATKRQAHEGLDQAQAANGLPICDGCFEHSALNVSVRERAREREREKSKR